MEEENKTNSEEAPSQENTSESEEAVGTVDPVGDQTETKNSGTSPRRAKLTRFERWQVGSAIAAVFVASCGLVILYIQTQIISDQISIAAEQTKLIGKQTELMDRQLGLTEKGMQQTAEQNKQTIEASTAESRAALNAQIENSRLDQRAWVGVVEVTKPTYAVDGLMVYMKEGEFLDFAAVITNSGKTPALRVRVRITYRVLDPEVPFIPRYTIQPEDARSETAIQPGMRMSLSINSIVFRRSRERPKANKVDIINLKTQTRIFYFFGEIRYEDIFGEPHETTFCMWLRPELDTFSDCDTYNKVIIPLTNTMNHDILES